MRILFHYYKNRPEWMNEFFSELRIIWETKKYLIITSSVIAVASIATLSAYKNTNVTDLVSLQNKRNETILRELNDINSILHDVENNPFNNKQQQMALQSLEKDIASTQKSMANIAKSSDIQNISKQITLVKDDIDYQISDLKKAVSGSSGSKEFLTTSALPFHVISTD